MFGSALLLSGISAGAILAAAPAPAPLDFDRDVRPILANNCFSCHGFDPAKRAAGLRLDTPEGAYTALASGHRGFVPGNAKASQALQRVVSRTMPPASTGKKLTDAQIGTLRQWVLQGAKYTRHWALVPPRQPALPRVKNTQWPRNAIDYFILARLEKEGLRPAPEADPATLIRRVTLDLTGLPPTVAEVEAFVREVDAERHPSPNPSPGGRGGLSGTSATARPGGSAAINGRQEKQSAPRPSIGANGHPSPPGGGAGGGVPTAYERLIDRLLASPRYGERMAWDWLDAARYADTNGYQGDRTRTMWPWRDWVIRAFNRNMPYDQFTVEQLAGDLLPNATLEQRVATGFNRNHLLNGEGGRIPEESRVDYVVDRVDTTSTVWMGLTLGCARCHDHKFDPLAQKEYYSLFAYFNNLPETGSVDRGGNANPVLALPTPAQTARIGELTAQAQLQEKELNAAAPGSRERAARQKELDATRKALKEQQDGILCTMVMEERPQPRETFVLVRGAYDKPAEKVTPGVPASLPPLPAGAPPNRLALARWLVQPEHPLTSRVTVNRYWQMLFGTGLVKTSEDFGVQGERPSHPELLDWLATRFAGVSRPESRVPGPEKPDSGLGTVDSGLWNTKALLKLIVTSATYRQSSRVTPALAERDPENRLLARGPRFRLSSSALRDQALALGGLLVEKEGGPSVRGYQPPGVWEDATFGQITYQQDHGESLYRRSLYTFWRRIVGPTNLFDASARQTCTVRLARTNTPLHALVTLNDVTYVEAARAFAQRVLKQAPTPEARVEFAFQAATARKPTAAEREVLLRALERYRRQYAAAPEAARKLLLTGESPRDEALDPVEHAAYTGLCLMVLNLDEVLTKE